MILEFKTTLKHRVIDSIYSGLASTDLLGAPHLDIPADILADFRPNDEAIVTITLVRPNSNARAQWRAMRESSLCSRFKAGKVMPGDVVLSMIVPEIHVEVWPAPDTDDINALFWGEDADLMWVRLAGRGLDLVATLDHPVLPFDEVPQWA